MIKNCLSLEHYDFGFSFGREIAFTRYTLSMPLDPRRIRYEDEHLLIVSKLSRELVVAGKGAMHKLPLLDFLKKQYPSLLALHRLDFETSGLVAFGKHAEVLANVRDGHFEGWEKTYETLVLGRLPPKGEITFPLPARNGGGDVPALTKFRTIRLYKECAHVEAQIESGKHHQIRKHFFKLNHPLVCDELYGNTKMNHKFGKLLKIHHFFLHASHLKFPHPITGVMMDVKDPLPPSFERALDKLRSLSGGVSL